VKTTIEVEHRFKVGDTVYIKERRYQDNHKPSLCKSCKQNVTRFKDTIRKATVTGVALVSREGQFSPDYVDTMYMIGDEMGFPECVLNATKSEAIKSLEQFVPRE
jgi:hypothetical protein